MPDSVIRQPEGTAVAAEESVPLAGGMPTGTAPADTDDPGCPGVGDCEAPGAALEVGEDVEEEEEEAEAEGEAEGATTGALPPALPLVVPPTAWMLSQVPELSP